MGDGTEPSQAELQAKALTTYKKGHDGRVPVTVLTGFLGAVRGAVRCGPCAPPRRPMITNSIAPGTAASTAGHRPRASAAVLAACMPESDPNC